MLNGLVMTYREQPTLLQSDPPFYHERTDHDQARKYMSARKHDRKKNKLTQSITSSPLISVVDLPFSLIISGDEEFRLRSGNSNL
jgi:hypothetical protein